MDKKSSRPGKRSETLRWAEAIFAVIVLMARLTNCKVTYVGFDDSWRIELSFEIGNDESSMKAIAHFAAAPP